MALRRQDWMILWGIFTCALTLRIGCLYYFALSRELSPFELSSDDTYHSLALDLLLGSGWSSQLFAARPPLMPLFVAGLYGIFGESHLAVAVANTLLGSATAALAYLVGLRLIHNTPFSVVAGGPGRDRPCLHGAQHYGASRVSRKLVYRPISALVGA